MNFFDYLWIMILLHYFWPQLWSNKYVTHCLPNIFLYFEIHYSVFNEYWNNLLVRYGNLGKFFYPGKIITNIFTWVKLRFPYRTTECLNLIFFKCVFSHEQLSWATNWWLNQLVQFWITICFISEIGKFHTSRKWN